MIVCKYLHMLTHWYEVGTISELKYRKAGEQESLQNKQKYQRFLGERTVPLVSDFLEKDRVARRQTKYPLLRQKAQKD